jgi:hypothetical protein
MVLRSFLSAFVSGFLLLASPLGASAQSTYFPGASWEHKTPAEAGLNPALLKDAIDFAVANETNFFLNTQKKLLRNGPETAFMFIGNGANVIYIDQEHDIVAVVRWIDNKAMDGFVKRLLAAAEAS